MLKLNVGSSSMMKTFFSQPIPCNFIRISFSLRKGRDYAFLNPQVADNNNNNKKKPILIISY